MKIVAKHDVKCLRSTHLDGISIPQFTVIFGPNGSGKSTFLEALQSQRYHLEGIGETSPNSVRFFGLGGLSSIATGQPVTASVYAEPWADLANRFSATKQNIRHHHPQISEEDFERELCATLVSYGLTTLSELEQIKTSSGKRIGDCEVSDLTEHFPAVASKGRDLFSVSLTELFVGYRIRLSKHQYRQWLERDAEIKSEISDARFILQHGPAPWEQLDEILSTLDLRYRFIPPPEDLERTQYQVELRHRDGDQVVTLDALSSGERVFITIASAVLLGENGAGRFSLPSLVLLDEADASLHPSMVKKFLDLVGPVLVQRYGIPVIMTTHSPTTAAIAPELSLFEMSASSSPQLRASDRDSALKTLTMGIPSLSVRVENRRQIFVESPYDQQIFQSLATTLKARVSSDVSFEFIAVGKNGIPGGCDKVVSIVADLSSSGVDTVHGIVDRDRRRSAPANIHFIKDRYSIENVVLDPVLLSIFLIRERVVSPVDMGLRANLLFFELDSSQAQTVADYIRLKLGLSDDELTEVSYVGGFSVAVPKRVLEMPGHEYERLVRDVFRPLNRFPNLKFDITERVMAEKPDFIPLSVLETLSQIE